MRKNTSMDRFADWVTAWIGTNSSIYVHTFVFLWAFASHWLHHWAWDHILLVLTTGVSIEAIFLSLFCQRAVNMANLRIAGVEETLDNVEDTLDSVEDTLDDASAAAMQPGMKTAN